MSCSGWNVAAFPPPTMSSIASTSAPNPAITRSVRPKFWSAYPLRQRRRVDPEMPDRLHHAILGPGGVGGLVGACLAHSGGAVTLVVRPASLAQYPRRLHLESRFGNFEVEVACGSEVPPSDVLWITVKATQLESALTALKNPGSVKAIVPLLNGIDHLSLLR